MNRIVNHYSKGLLAFKCLPYHILSNYRGITECTLHYNSFKFSKVDKELSPYWLYLSLSRNYGRTAFPIIFGKRRELIEKGLGGEYAIKTVEMKKRREEWYAHFNLKKEVVSFH